MGWQMFRVQRAEDRHQHGHGEEQTRPHPNSVERREKLSGTPEGQFPYRRSKSLRHWRKNYSLHLGEPHNRETKN